MRSNLVWMVLALSFLGQKAGAQGDPLGADGMAEAIVSMTSPVWTGPRTAFPTPVARPEASFTIRSPFALVAVHDANPARPQTAQRVLRALEHARARLDALGWPAPLSDGDLGGGPELDLYVTDALPEGGHADGMVSWAYLDRASTFAVIHPAGLGDGLETHVTRVYAEAMLLSLDPAEARAWRRATASWLAWELTGQPGCDDAIFQQQAEPHRSWIEGAAGDGAGGAIWLAYLAGRHDDGSHGFIRDVWSLATQRTWEGAGLRAEPDLWSAMDVAITLSGDRLLDNVEELAVLRWFVGRGPRPHPLVAAMDADAKTPVARRMTRLPSRVTAPHPLQPFGSTYVLIRASAWQDATRLHAWLQGEYGVRWSLVAVQLDRDRAELARISTPHTATTPRAYLPIELDPRARELLLVITNLSHGLPDADEPDIHERAFELIVDRMH